MGSGTEVVEETTTEVCINLIETDVIKFLLAQIVLDLLTHVGTSLQG